MNERVLKYIRISLKVSVSISLVIFVGLLLNYCRNLNPTTDGFDVTNLVARLIHGDGYWTWEKLTSGVYTAGTIFTVLFCIDKVLDMVNMKS